MKAIVNDKIYIQKKDIELIIKSTNKESIPQIIIDSYEQNQNLKELDFLEFNNKSDIDFLNKFWFIVNYNDFKDFTELEIVDYRMNDLTKLRAMRQAYDKNYLLDNKIYTDIVDLLSERVYFIPNKNQAKKYPIDFQLLYNKVLDFDIIYKLKCNEIKINLPEEIVNPICYSKKQLQQIYYEVLCNELSFEELKPIEKQLYSIFTRINFTPKIQTIIRKIIELNKYTDIGFIQDELLDLLLYLQYDKTKFSSISSIIDLIVNLYAIGYNNFENFDSKIVLEMDLKRIKRAIFSILISKSDAYFINRLSKYNCILAQIITELKKIDFTYENRILRDIILNMSVYVYFKPEIINNKFDFIPEVYKYLEDNQEKVINMLNYTVNSTADFDDNFINYFNNSNKLLIHLYNEKYNNNKQKKLNKTE